MELSKEQMEKVIYELECNYNSKIFDDENLIEIINLFKKYLNSGETKWLLQELEKTNSNYLFKNLGGYSMDSKTKSIWLEEGLLRNEVREKILQRCEILRYMGDDGISCIFDQLPDDELMEDCGWVLDKEHDDLDQYQFGVTKKIMNDAPARQSNDMWG